MQSTIGTTFDVGITTLTDVDAISRIAYDIRDMAESLEQGEWVTARRIYEQGKNAPQYDLYGNEMDQFLSLQNMAKEMSDGKFNEDPNYMFQVLGLANVGQSIEETIATHGGYADNYIMKQLNDYSSGTLGAQSTAILIVPMYATHQLWDGLMDCIAIYDGFNPVPGQKSKINPKQSFDNFIALYVGAGQTLAPDWEGDMLYELAQAGGDLFETTDSEGEAFVNSYIRENYQSLQRLMSEDDYCKRYDTVKSVWLYVNRIIAKMYIPITQMLIHSMKEEDQAHKVRMYSLALIPQLSQCNSSIHRKLKDYLLDKEYDREDFPRILELLQQTYDCLGFSCADIGAYNDDEVAECADYEAGHPLAAFIPKEDVRSLSKIDLDILAVEQLLKFPSNTKNQMAKMYYQYGRANALDENDFGYDLTSLQDMTQLSSDAGQWSPYYSDYIEYFKEDKFLDTAIMNAFDDVTGDADQRKAFIVSLMQNNVIPEFSFGLLGLALQICHDPANDEEPTKYWDGLAAMYIGSLEGIKAGGSDDDGMMLWGLATNRARQFNTQNINFGAIVNDRMVDLLFAGQSQLERRDCVNFEKTASRVLHLMLVPLIQSTIWYAIRNEKSPVAEDVARGEASAFSVLPIVSKYDNNAASVIERNMVRVEGVQPVSEGPQSVANAFYQILDDIGYGCDLIGQAEGIDICENYDPDDFSSGSTFLMSGTVTIFGSIISVFVWS